jgi:hypothetical protein
MADNIQEKIEDKIIDLIALGARGRLIVFKPENSDIDLVVEKRGDYKKKVIFLNIRKKELVAEKNFTLDENFYFVFVDFDIVKQDISENIFFVPSLELQKITDEKDLSRFLINKKDFVRFLIEKFE